MFGVHQCGRLIPHKLALVQLRTQSQLSKLKAELVKQTEPELSWIGYSTHSASTQPKGANSPSATRPLANKPAMAVRDATGAMGEVNAKKQSCQLQHKEHARNPQHTCIQRCPSTRRPGRRGCRITVLQDLENTLSSTAPGTADDTAAKASVGVQTG